MSYSKSRYESLVSELNKLGRELSWEQKLPALEHVVQELRQIKKETRNND